MAAKRPRLTRADWTEAALAALVEGGVAAVAIEPLASKLGATKGSAYWHFANREELLRATLERWEQDRTDATIELVDAEPDPVGRLRALFSAVYHSPESAQVELALLSAATNPTVQQTLERVTERRIAYLAEQFTQLGFPLDTARRRAVLAYSTYLGNAHLRRSAPATLPTEPRDWASVVDDALHTLSHRLTE
ncbi:TetR/AcrR family transcriptional regulator [Nocardia callitridis]|uniref:TetR/AcrR family transcriptional regulator n=1 Tax=Nocardia callitridis TaxID=648753 RepID=A0ABP9JT98_9NOCA